MTARKYSTSDIILGTTTISDYMRWAFSDLSSNATRGVFVEFLVKTALEIDSEHLDEWAPYDLLYRSQRLEIKSTSLVQTWTQKKLSEGRFDIKQRSSGRNSDFYIFAANTQNDRALLDMLNFKDWIFFVVSTDDINKKFGGQRSVGLKVLQSHFECCDVESLKSVLDSKLK